MSGKPPLNLDLTGDDGNILIVVAKAEKVMRQTGYSIHVISTMRQNALAAESYTAALGIIAMFVNLNDGIFEGMK